MKYVICIDYLAGFGGLEYHGTIADTLEEAIQIANDNYKKEANKIYLMKILKKTSSVKIDTEDKNLRYQEYEAVMVKRQNNEWHENNEKNLENQLKARQYWVKNDSKQKKYAWFETM